MKTGFDNQKYLKLQSEKIRERIASFDNKLYLEFGGKLFDDYHASRVLPGFEPASKLQMLLQLCRPGWRSIIVINAQRILKKIKSVAISASRTIRDRAAPASMSTAVKGPLRRRRRASPAMQAQCQCPGVSAAKLEKSWALRSIAITCIAGYPKNIPLIVSDKRIWQK